MCSPINLGSLLIRKGPTSWRRFIYNYTAQSSTLKLSFGFQGNGTDANYLDAASVVDVAVSSVELLKNPSFESSSFSAPTGWNTSCQNSCTGSNDEGRVISINCQPVFGSFCFWDACRTGVDFLAQSVLATVGHTYIISFWLMQSGPASFFFADIYP